MMREALSLDLREEVKAMFFAGLQPSEIAAQKPVKAATVSKWATRYGWSSKRDRAVKNAVKNLSGIASGKTPVTIVVSESDNLSKRGENTRLAIANELDRTLASLSSVKTAKTLEHAGPRATTLTKLAETASKVYGWGNDSVTIQFGVSMLSEVQAPVESTPVVDVTPTVTQGENPPSDATPQS